MACIEYSRVGIRNELFDSEEGRIKIIERILKGLGYEDVQSTEQIPGQCKRLVIGNYRGKDGSTYGVFVDYVDKESGTHIEISTTVRERAEEIKERIGATFPNIECRIENSC
jgi:hypothetical protein